MRRIPGDPERLGGRRPRPSGVPVRRGPSWGWILLAAVLALVFAAFVEWSELRDYGSGSEAEAPAASQP